MAGVIATSRASALAASHSQSPKTCVKLGVVAGFFSGKAPVTGSKLVTPWYLMGSDSAGAKPLPLAVTMCRNTGRSVPRSSPRAPSSASRSWPSMGPTYSSPKVRTQSPGPLGSPGSSLAGRRMCGAASMASRAMVRAEWLRSAPTFSEIDMSLSL